MIGDEDVLDGTDEPVERWERTRFHRKRDVLVVAVIGVAALVGGLLLWQSSDLRATTSQTASSPLESPARPAVFPPSLAEVWRADSSATPEPVTVGPALVTGNNTEAGGEVAGRDPLTGEVRWRYARDLPLCTVSSAWQLALAVYARTDNLLRADDPRKAGGCSEVTALWPETGQRGRPARPDEQRDNPYLGTRNSDAELGTRLLSDGTYVTATGDSLLTTWRSDLVQTMEYGRIGALQNPGKQPRNGCEYGTVAVVTGKIAVVERCPTDPGDRLTVYKATGEDDSEKPVEVASVVVGNDAKVVAMSEQCRLDPEAPDDVQQCTAVALPNPNRLVLLDEQGEQVRTYPLELAPDDLRGEPEGHTMSVNRVTGAVYWYTGSRTIALSLDDLRPLWTVENAMGPGTAFAGKILVPVTGGIAVLDPATGEVVANTPIDRGGHDGEITMSALGPMVFEQRGDTLVALR
ncbi:hypothetical protein [Actinophytocola glycyrrhizae]|uniref:Pyrroloquinoline-quinone binding quinoprotein n=1 Tax=Actinophytocola glycyrrhizae TaxID=2044873 RepID=A0ABV9RY41_9PSEU